MGGGKRVMILALMMGLVTSVLVWNYMQQLAQNAQPVVMVPVLVAARDIPARAVLTEDLVKVQQVSAEARHPQALTSRQAAAGQIAKMPIAAGEQILSSKFFGQRKESGLAFVVPPGRRAVSVGVTEIIGSGGLIVPGDRVDVLAVFDARYLGKETATTVLQNVEVLAVAQQLEGEPPKTTSEQLSQGMGFGGGNAQPDKVEPKTAPMARSVTLSVNPDDAQRLVLAEERGKIRLALRAYSDQDIVELAPVTLTPTQTQTAMR